jgi:putative ABC transport system permease protein
MLRHHLKTTLRLFMRNKSIALINFFGMSIGFASIIIIGNWVYNEVSFDGFHENKDRIYRVVEKQSFKGQDEKYLSSLPEWLTGTFEEDIRGVEASTGLFRVGNLWFGEKDNQIELKNVTFTDNNIFKIFTFNFISGSPENALSDPLSIVISESLAKKISPDKSPVGQSMLYQGEIEYVITAVIKDIPENSHFQAEVLVSIEGRKAAWDTEDYNHTTSIYLLLYEHTDPKSLIKPLQAHKDKYLPHNAESIEFQIQPLSAVHLYSKHTMWGQNYKKSDITLVYMFVIIGILVIVISTINYINLSTASMSKRFKEFGLKKVVGSSKSALIFQFLFESFLLLFLSFWLSLLLIEIVNPFLNSYNILEQTYFIYHQIWFFPLMLACIILLSILSGIYPAIVLSSVKPISLFKKNFNSGKKGLSLKRVLVVTQLSITCILIISVIYISKQINFMQHKELGYSREAVINIWSSQAIRENYQTIKSDLLQHNSIINITSSNVPLGNSMWRNCIHFEGELEGDEWVTPYMMVDYNFVDFYNIKIIHGRGFNEKFALDKDKKAFLINETLAKKMGGENIVGRKFRTCSSNWGEIVGVVQDFNYRSLHHSVEPLAIQLGKNYNNLISINANTENIQGTIDLLEKTWNEYQANQPFSFSFLDQSLNNLYKSEQRTARIEIIFCVISIVLSCIGLLGMYLFVTENKTKEIGIRKVNGASAQNILTMLSRELVINVIIALCISIPIGWIVVTNWVNDFAFKAQISWWIFAVSGILIFLLAWLTISYHSIKAARKNPVEALRYE